MCQSRSGPEVVPEGMRLMMAPEVGTMASPDSAEVLKASARSCVDMGSGQVQAKVAQSSDW